MTKLKIEGWIPSSEVAPIMEVKILVDTGVEYIMKIEYLEVDIRDSTGSVKE